MAVRRPIGRADDCESGQAPEPGAPGHAPPETVARTGVFTRCCAPLTETRVGPAEAVRWSAVGRALSDPTRIEILGVLAAAGRELCACEIEGRFDLAQPTVSHHLRVLREAGLVTRERRGCWVHFALNGEGLDLIDALARTLKGDEP